MLALLCATAFVMTAAGSATAAPPTQPTTPQTAAQPTNAPSEGAASTSTNAEIRSSQAPEKKTPDAARSQASQPNLDLPDLSTFNTCSEKIVSNSFPQICAIQERIKEAQKSNQPIDQIFYLQREERRLTSSALKTEEKKILGLEENMNNARDELESAKDDLNLNASEIEKKFPILKRKNQSEKKRTTLLIT